MVDHEIRTRHLRLPNRGETRHMFYTGHERLCIVENSAHHGQFQDKEKNADY